MFLVQRLKLALSKGPNRVSSPSFYLRKETDPVSETLCFLETLDDGQSPKTRFFQTFLTLTRSRR
jgi:hypothetical protein